MIFSLTTAALIAFAASSAGPRAFPAPPIDRSIDSIVDQHLPGVAGQTPAELCSDSLFLRRVMLDLVGRIPTVGELQEFMQNPNRPAKIDQLLASTEHARFMSEIWTASLVGYSNVFGTDREALRMWLEKQLEQDVPFDEMATALITARGASSLNGPVNFLVRHLDDPVVKVGRMFLGVRLDCAQCHDHPFDRWTQEDYQRMRMFFGQVRTPYRDGTVLVHDELGRASRDQRPVFLTGARPRTDHWRAELALFVTNSKPFARTFGNRIWYHLMGRGVVDPIDDFNTENPPAVPQLVEYLAEQSRRHKFSIRDMLRLICNSHAYQRVETSIISLESQEPVRLRVLKPLTPGQYFDSIATALDRQVTAAERQRFVQSMVGDVLQEDFNPTWKYRETVQTAMSRLAMPMPHLNDSLEEIYLRVLSRQPTPRELELCRGRPKADVLFALIHSNEFFFNH